MDEKLIIKRLVVGSLSANCWIVGARDTGEGMVIDPGGNAEGILKAIDDTGLDIGIIVLTPKRSRLHTTIPAIKLKTIFTIAVPR